MTHKALLRQLQISCLGLDAVDPLRLLVDDVVEALRENAMREVQRLGQEIEQEPVAWMDADGNVSDNNDHKCFPIPLYTTPPQRTWVGLTDDEYAELAEEFGPFPINQIEAKLKEKNT